MSDMPRRRLLDRMGSAPSLLAPRSRVVGDIETDGPLLINGSVRGDGSIGGELAIAAGAQWDGDVRAKRAAIAGTLNGSLIVEDKLEIGATAVIRGRVVARMIAIARGAVVEGEVSVTGNQPVVRFEEKRAAVPVE